MDQINEFQQKDEQCQVIKPCIKTSLLMLQSFINTLLFYLFSVWFLIGPLISFFGVILPMLFNISLSTIFLLTIISNLVLFISVFLIIYFLRRATLNRTEYRFYSDRIEYFEGFLVKNRKTVTYDKISNIGQRKGIIEGWFGLGTIFIDTPGSSPQGHEISITYLDNPDGIYDWMSKIISKKK